MNNHVVIAAIDAEIERLQHARALLSGSAVYNRVVKVRRRRKLSPEAIERIRAAQRKRWAKAKKASK